MVPVMIPAAFMLRPGGRPIATNVKVSPFGASMSWKNDATLTLTVSLSALLRLASVSAVGASFCGTILIVSVAVSMPLLPSLVV